MLEPPDTFKGSEKGRVLWVEVRELRASEYSQVPAGHTAHRNKDGCTEILSLKGIEKATESTSWFHIENSGDREICPAQEEGFESS